MEGTGYPSDILFSNTTASGFGQARLSPLIDRLSLILTGQQIFDLSSELRGTSDEALYLLVNESQRRSSSLSDTQRSSLISNLSYRSIASNFSAYSQDPTSFDHPPYDQFTPPTQAPATEVAKTPSRDLLSQTAATLRPEKDPFRSSLRNRDSPFPDLAIPYQKVGQNRGGGPVDTTFLPIPKFYCFGCDERFATQGTLSRHQKEKCERKMVSTCTLCQKTYSSKDRLERHHVTKHGNECSNGCNKQQNSLSSLCKEHLSRSFIDLPAKRTWGCPYCTSWFHTFVEWNEHCTNHSTQGGKALKWSFERMIRSLLLQPFIGDALVQLGYDWTSCAWHSLSKDTHSDLRYALERCRLPPAAQHDLYRNLSHAEAVINFVYHHISTVPSVSKRNLLEIPNDSTRQDLEAQYPIGVVHQHMSYAHESRAWDKYSAGYPGFDITTQALALKPLDDFNDQQGTAFDPEESTENDRMLGMPSDSVSAMTVQHGRAYDCNDPKGLYIAGYQTIVDPPVQDLDTEKQQQSSRMRSGSGSRHRCASIKRSLSNLSLRGKSNVLTPEATPPVPAMPDNMKYSGGSRPMSGVIQEGNINWRNIYDDLASQYTSA